MAWTGILSDNPRGRLPWKLLSSLVAVEILHMDKAHMANACMENSVFSMLSGIGNGIAMRRIA